jgi:hypothetical protein
MSNPKASRTGKKSSSRKGRFPTRNVISLVVLLVVVAVGWIQYSALGGYNSAVKSLDELTKADDQGLLTIEEAEKRIGRSPDGPGISSKEGDRTIIKMTYTWRGLLKSYKLTAVYMKESDIRLLRYETVEAKNGAVTD